jgi:hypothetical protein
MNHLGIDVGKRKCRVSIKDDNGMILNEFFFDNDGSGIHNLISRIRFLGECYTRAVLKSTGKMVIRINPFIITFNNSWHKI